jgi:competence protein ComEC
MAAAHHGSINGINAKSLLIIQPNTVLISAGVNNQYGHPSQNAVAAYSKVARHVFSTNLPDGGSLWTRRSNGDFTTTRFN